MHRGIPGLTIILLLSGCAAMPPPHDFVPGQIRATNHQIMGILDSVTVVSKQTIVVTTSTGVQLTGAAYPERHDVRRNKMFDEWENAVKIAAENSKLFNAHGKALSLVITLQNMDQTGFGSRADTKISAQYQLSVKESREIVFDEVIISETTATMSDAIVGGVRGQIALNRAVQHNIKTFIQSIEAASRNGKLRLSGREQYVPRVNKPAPSAETSPR